MMPEDLKMMLCTFDSIGSTKSPQVLSYLIPYESTTMSIALDPLLSLLRTGPEWQTAGCLATAGATLRSTMALLVSFTLAVMATAASAVIQPGSLAWTLAPLSLKDQASSRIVSSLIGLLGYLLEASLLLGLPRGPRPRVMRAPLQPSLFRSCLSQRLLLLSLFRDIL